MWMERLEMVWRKEGKKQKSEKKIKRVARSKKALRYREKPSKEARTTDPPPELPGSSTERARQNTHSEGRKKDSK